MSDVLCWASLDGRCDAMGAGLPSLTRQTRLPGFEQFLFTRSMNLLFYEMAVDSLEPKSMYSRLLRLF